MSPKTNEVSAEEIIWQTPNLYDHFMHGPPYLKMASNMKTAVRALVLNERKALVSNRIRKNATVDDAVQSFLEGCAADYNQPTGEPVSFSELGALLAVMRALAWMYQTHHWQTLGPTYYGDHLLFERLYGEVNSNIDKVAEKATGKGQVGLVDPLIQVQQVAVALTLFRDRGVLYDSQVNVEMSLRAVLRTLACIDAVKLRLEQQGRLSSGVSNLLDDIADNLESHVYLLKQRAGGVPVEARVVAASSGQWKVPR